MEELRYILDKVELIVIDEISMFSSEHLYRIHKKLCEIFLCKDYFGGRAILLVGDLMQLRPVRASYIFQAPKSPRFLPFHSVGCESQDQMLRER